MQAAQVTVRSIPEWRTKYLYLMMRRGRKIAKVAMALITSWFPHSSDTRPGYSSLAYSSSAAS
ncbi:MAG TPA: hypothetical protein VEI01_24615 [Terriglobales bacterium]|nr:hypothetical protein [Terriglobales bacterium]